MKFSVSPGMAHFALATLLLVHGDGPGALVLAVWFLGASVIDDFCPPPTEPAPRWVEWSARLLADLCWPLVVLVATAQAATRRLRRRLPPP